MASAEHLDDTEQDETLASDERAKNSFLNMKVADKDEAGLLVLVLRDVFAVSILLAIFGGAHSWALATGLGLATLVVTVVGLAAGAAASALGHEWGHFIGARLGGGHSPTKPFSKFPQLFDFDYKNNDAKSFRWMSVGGNLGNWGVALLLAWALPLGTAGPDALVAGAVGFSVFTALVEFPVIARARAGMSGIDALMKIPRDFTTRYIPHALGAAVLVFLVL